MKIWVRIAVGEEDASELLQGGRDAGGGLGRAVGVTDEIRQTR